MKINLIELIKNEGVKKSFSLSREVKSKEIKFCGEKVKIVKPILVSGNMVNYEGKINVKIKTKTGIQRICSRCLNKYTEEINIESDYVFSKERKDSDEDVIIFSGDTIDIFELLLEEIIAQMSMKPLCKESCKGLCPICGSNKNFADCNCVLEQLDPRLEILKKFTLKE